MVWLLLCILPCHVLAVSWEGWVWWGMVLTWPLKAMPRLLCGLQEGLWVQLRKGNTTKENQHVGEEQDDEGGSNISALCSAMLTANSKGLPPQCLHPWAGLNLAMGASPAQPLVAEKQPLWPALSPRNLSKWEGIGKWGQRDNGGGMWQGLSPRHGTSPVTPRRFDLNAHKGVNFHLTVLLWVFPLYESCYFLVWFALISSRDFKP